MTDKLRECPFGGDNIELADRGLTVFCGGTYYSEEAEMELEYCYSVPIEVFRTRPTEDRLREEIENHKAQGQELVETCLELGHIRDSLKERVEELETIAGEAYPGIAADMLAAQRMILKLAGENEMLQKRVEELEKALDEAIGWNWFEPETIDADVRSYVYKALAGKE